jgi:arylsulfatase A-like enzyme
MDVHQYLYSEDEALFGTTYLDIYDNSIRWVDGLIGHLIEELTDRGLREKTLIVLASDHGEAFGEHGNEGHARDVYGEVTTTPFIVSFPFRLEPGIVVDARTANVDLWPTLLDLTGMPPLVDPDGRSRMPEIVAAARGEAAPDNVRTFALIDETWGRERQQPAPIVAVDQGAWRLIHSVVRPEQSELYRKDQDPQEHRNLAAENPEVVEELKRLVVGHLEGPPAPWGDVPQSIELDEMQLDQLRALGYGVQ